MEASEEKLLHRKDIYAKRIQNKKGMIRRAGRRSRQNTSIQERESGKKHSI